MKVYNGTGKYIYISYAHKDYERIEPILIELIKQGYHIWYDRGIEFGSEWIEYNANKIINCTAFMLYITENFVKSINCKNELTLAVSKGKNILAIYMDNVELSPGLQLQLANVQFLDLQKYASRNDFMNQLLDNEVFKNPELISKDNLELIDIELLEKSIIANQKVAIGICVYNGNVLMVKRKVQEGRLLWQFPAAMVRKTESLEEKIVREVYQETNIKTKYLKTLGSRIHPDTGVISVYLVLEYLDGIIENKDEYENEEVCWISLSNYKDYITSDLFIKVKEYLEEHHG